MTEPARRHDAIALGILAAIITLAFVDVLAGINSLYVRDLLHFHYPAKQVLREIVLGGEFPHWNPWFGAGQPMAANPQHEVFYPPNWLILLPSYRLGFHLLIVLHLYVAAFAMYALLRALRVRAAAAFFGALAFALGGVAASYLTLLPFLFSVAWLPLTCLYVRKFLLTRSPRAFALASVFLGIQLVLGEPTTILQTGILLGVFAVARFSVQGPRAATRAVAMVGLIILAGLLLSAVQMVPAIDHARDSVRSRGLPFDDVTDWSFPPARLGELFHPHLLGHVDVDVGQLYWGASLYPERRGPFLYSVYPGLLLSLLAIAGMTAGVRGRWTFAALFALSVLLALGAATPLWRLLYDLGLARSLRYPEKFILTALFALIVFGARALDELLAGNERVRSMTVRIAAGVTVIAGAAALFAWTPAYARLFAGIWTPNPERLEAMLAASATGWLAVTARGGAVLLLARNANRARRTFWLTLAGLFTVLDLGAVLREAAPRMPSRFYDPPALVKVFPADRTPWRLFHHASWHTRRSAALPYRVPHRDRLWLNRNAMLPLMPAQHGIRMALEVDYDLTALTPTADFVTSVAELSDLRPDWVDVAASMSNVWYRAVFRVPAEAFGEARGDLRAVQPVGILALEHTPRYFFAEQMEPISGRDDFVRKVSSRRFGKRTVFVEGDTFPPAPGRVLRTRETANTARIEIETAGRSFLYISVTPHRYWTITIDGREAPAVVANVGYQGVVVPSAGRHIVEMRYRNPLFAVGGAITLAALVLLGLLAARNGGDPERAP